MTEKPHQVDIADPHCVQDMLCNGPFNVAIHSPLATITFTNQIPDARKLFNGAIEPRGVVAARITMTVDNLITLKELLTQVIAGQKIGSVTAVAGARPN